MGARRHRRPAWISALVRLILAILYAVPVAWIVLTSFKPEGDVFDKGWGVVVFRPVLAAYQESINAGLLVAARQSLIIAVGTTIIVLAVGVPCAYALARTRGVVASLGLGLLIVLQMVPQTSIVIPLFQIYASAGLLDQTIAIVLADAALLTPFAILLLRPFFRAVPLAIEEAGSIDGASTFRLFWSIALPISRNGVATTGTLVFIISWGEFLYSISFFLSPGKYPMSALLSQQITAFGIDWPALMALAVLMSIPILILFVCTYRLLRNGLTMGAVK